MKKLLILLLLPFTALAQTIHPLENNIPHDYLTKAIHTNNKLCYYNNNHSLSILTSNISGTVKVSGNLKVYDFTTYQVVNTSSC